jgi:transposase
LISSAEGKSVREISRSLFCSDQCVRDAISNFNKDGLRCINKKRNKKNKTSAFSQAALKSLEKIVSHPPSYYGLKSELWTLEILANVCYKQKVIKKPVSSRTVGFIVKKIGLNWKQIKRSMRK